MKKIILLVSLLSFIFPVFSQSTTSPEDYHSIQRFVEATVQVPFMARVANVQGEVSVRVTTHSNNNSFSYEIEKGLRADCNLEALRVVKLINIKNLKELLQNKSSIILQVPFKNYEKITLEHGYVLNYFQSFKQPTAIDSEVKYLRKYLADTTTGIIKSNAEYYDLKNKKNKTMAVAFLVIDTVSRGISDYDVDSVKIYKYSGISTGGFPNIYFEHFDNGQVSFKEFGKTSFYYYPNGRIKTLLTEAIVDSESVVNETNWYSNGQVASYSTFYKNEPTSPHKYITVWDTLGNKMVENGKGEVKFYKNDGVEIGAFKNGYKDGIWIKKNKSCKLEYREKYDESNLLGGTKYIGQDSINYDVVDLKASFIGGMKNLGKHLITNLKYPIDAQRAGLQGTVFVEFTVCTDGTLCDYTITKGIDESMNKEALRVVKLTNGKWKSGKSRGEPVKTRFTLPITFQSLGIVNLISR